MPRRDSALNIFMQKDKLTETDFVGGKKGVEGHIIGLDSARKQNDGAVLGFLKHSAEAFERPLLRRFAPSTRNPSALPHGAAEYEPPKPKELTAEEKLKDDMIRKYVKPAQYSLNPEKRQQMEDELNHKQQVEWRRIEH